MSQETTEVWTDPTAKAQYEYLLGLIAEHSRIPRWVNTSDSGQVRLYQERARNKTDIIRRAAEILASRYRMPAITMNP